MTNSIDQEKIIFNYIQKHPEYIKIVNGDFFKTKEIQEIYNVTKKFFNQFAETPSVEQTKVLLKESESKITDSLAESIFSFNVFDFDQDWLKSTTEAWIRWCTFNKNLVKAVEFTKTTDVGINNVEDVVNRAVGIIQESNTITFNKDLGSDFFDISSHKSIIENKIPCNFDYINKVSHGGLDPKTLNVYLGGTNVGKSIFLCNDAAGFVMQGKNVVYITCEMSESKVLRRITSNMLNITIEEYEKLTTQPDKLKQKIDDFKMKSFIPLGKLWVKEYPTSSATTIDIENYIRELEETQQFKVDVVLVDYIGILSNYRNPNSENTYMKIKQLAEDLRAIAVRRNVLMFSAMQIGRNAINGTDLNIEDVSESMALIHTCDSVWGIIQDSTMLVNSEYYLKILKIREGEGKGNKFRLKINYDKMKITELVESEIDTNSHLKEDNTQSNTQKNTQSNKEGLSDFWDL